MPPSPMPPGAATPMAPRRGGQEAQGEVLAGLGLHFLRKAVSMLGSTPKGQKVAEAIARLGKEFVVPAGDLSQSELKFASAQAPGGGPSSPMMAGGQAQQSLAGAGVPAAAPPPMPAPAGAPGG